MAAHGVSVSVGSPLMNTWLRKSGRTVLIEEMHKGVNVIYGSYGSAPLFFFFPEAV